ncbi:hypothetical protein KBW71_00735 [Hydrogenophaga aromaticivorans]|uniref:polymer-forming cytoskeletal protein n=1 Tax=Hydrogenophaga aromaticivorans TaxID=2610898 RepID=UPI001B389E82|nr:polymer-forming cytoskeletal protein [Hydrogenophaga aromaticivorans]MBQ0916977.1 hypothetical protein [Hydrogenophaga aromaticivorans]
MSKPSMSAFVADQHQGDLPAVGETAGVADVNSLSMRLEEHQICFVVPAGARIDAQTLDLPGGILVLGALRGKVTCACGSAIIALGGEFQGSLDAVDIYIEGRVTSKVVSQAPVLTKLRARGVAAAGGGFHSGLVAFSTTSVVQAHVQARAFHIPRQADLKRTVLETLMS